MTMSERERLDINSNDINTDGLNITKNNKSILKRLIQYPMCKRIQKKRK